MEILKTILQSLFISVTIFIPIKCYDFYQKYQNREAMVTIFTKHSTDLNVAIQDLYLIDFSLLNKKDKKILLDTETKIHQLNKQINVDMAKISSNINL